MEAEFAAAGVNCAAYHVSQPYFEIVPFQVTRFPISKPV